MSKKVSVLLSLTVLLTLVLSACAPAAPTATQLPATAAPTATSAPTEAPATAAPTTAPTTAPEETFAPDVKAVITITLPKGATWSDGTPLTSKDVVGTWNILWMRKSTSWDSLFDVVAKDDQTVQWQISTPGPAILDAIVRSNLNLPRPYSQYGKWMDAAAKFRAANADRDGADVFGMPVSLQSLGRDGSRLQPHALADARFYIRIEMCKSSDGSRQFSNRNRLRCLLHPLAIAPHFVVPEGHLDSEGDRFGMDAMGAADHRGIPVLEGALFDCFHEPADVVDDEVARLLEKHGKGSVEHVRGGKPQMDEAGIVADVVGHRGEKGDDIVLDDLLYLIDARHIELCPGLYPFYRIPGDIPQLGMGFTGVYFNIKPLLVPVFRFPNARHFGSAVSLYHCLNSLLLDKTA